MDRRLIEKRPHAGRSAGVIAVPVRQYQVPDQARVEAIAFDVLDDGLSPHPGTDVDQRKLVSAIDQVDVAVVGVGEVEAVAARSDEVDALRQPHGLRKLKL